GVLLVRLDRRLGPDGQGPHLPRERPRGDEEPRRRRGEEAAGRGVREAGRGRTRKAARPPAPGGPAGGAVPARAPEGRRPAGEGGARVAEPARPAARRVGARDDRPAG